MTLYEPSREHIGRWSDKDFGKALAGAIALAKLALLLSSPALPPTPPNAPA